MAYRSFSWRTERKLNARPLQGRKSGIFLLRSSSQQEGSTYVVSSFRLLLQISVQKLPNASELKPVWRVLGWYLGYRVILCYVAEDWVVPTFLGADNKIIDSFIKKKGRTLPYNFNILWPRRQIVIRIASTLQTLLMETNKFGIGLRWSVYGNIWTRIFVDGLLSHAWCYSAYLLLKLFRVFFPAVRPIQYSCMELPRQIV